MKLVLNQPFKNRSVFTFSSIFEFHQIINKAQLSPLILMKMIYMMSKSLEWLINVDSWIGHPLTYFMVLKCCQDNPSTIFFEVSQQHGAKSLLQWSSSMVEAYLSSVVVTWCQNSITDADLTPSWQYGDRLSLTISLLLFSLLFCIYT